MEDAPLRRHGNGYVATFSWPTPGCGTSRTGVMVKRFTIAIKDAGRRRKPPSGRPRTGRVAHRAPGQDGHTEATKTWAAMSRDQHCPPPFARCDYADSGPQLPPTHQQAPASPSAPAPAGTVS